MVRFSCKICTKVFTTKGSLKVHEFLHTGQKPFSCDKCEKSFAIKRCLNDHYLSHTRILKYSCEICKKRFWNKSYLKAHMIVHTTVKKFFCLKCNVSFKYKGSYRDHVCKIQKCKICDQIFPDKNALTQHFNTHPKKNPFVCQLCNNNFCSKSYLKVHISNIHFGKRIVRPKKSFICDVCNACFSVNTSLKRHLSKHHTDAKMSKKYVCYICKKTFVEKSTLRFHLRAMHINPRTYTCDVCEKKYNSKGSLNVHYKAVHLGIKSYNCEMCNKSFARSYILKRHQLVHTGEKPYTCVECNKQFSQKESLQGHIVIHSKKGQTYTCDKCNKDFYKETQLKRHKLIHTGENPNTCNKCNKVFISKNNLVKHYMVCVEMKGFNCDNCNRIFSSEYNLKQHKYYAKIKNSTICHQTKKKDAAAKFNIERHSKSTTYSNEEKIYSETNIIEMDEHLQNEVENSCKTKMSFDAQETFPNIHHLSHKNVDVALESNFAIQVNNELNESHVDVVLEKNVVRDNSQSIGKMLESEANLPSESGIHKNICDSKKAKICNKYKNFTVENKVETSVSQKKGHFEQCEEYTSNFKRSNFEEYAAADQNNKCREYKTLSGATKRLTNCMKYKENANLESKFCNSESCRKVVKENGSFKQEFSYELHDINLESVSDISLATIQNKEKCVKNLNYISTKQSEIDMFNCTPLDSIEYACSETLQNNVNLNEAFQCRKMKCIEVDLYNNFKSRPRILPRKVSYKLNILDIYSQIEQAYNSQVS